MLILIKMTCRSRSFLHYLSYLPSTSMSLLFAVLLGSRRSCVPRYGAIPSNIIQHQNASLCLRGHHTLFLVMHGGSFIHQQRLFLGYSATGSKTALDTSGFSLYLFCGFSSIYIIHWQFVSTFRWSVQAVLFRHARGLHFFVSAQRFNASFPWVYGRRYRFLPSFSLALAMSQLFSASLAVFRCQSDSLVCHFGAFSSVSWP